MQDKKRFLCAPKQKRIDDCGEYAIIELYYDREATIVLLTFDQIKAVTVGALRVEQQDDGVHFYKLTPKQLDYWAGLNEFMRGIAAASTGVHLDFWTDATAVTFTTAAGGKFELYKNRLMAEQVTEQEPHVITLTLKDAPSDVRNRVTLYLPCHGISGVIQRVELTDGTVCERPTYPVKMLFFGDSITQGWDSHFDTHSWAMRVARFYDAEALIQGVGGSFFATAAQDDVDFDPDIVFVALGTNDFNWYRNRPDDFEREMNGYLDRIAKTYAGKTIIAISPVTAHCYTGEERERFTLHCRKVLMAEAKRGFTCVDGFTLMPDVGALFLPDGLHPNAEGFGVYAENLLRQMNDTIQTEIIRKKMQK